MIFKITKFTYDFDCLPLMIGVCECVCVSVLQATWGPADQCVCEEKTSDMHRAPDRRGGCCDNSEWRVCDRS